MRRSTSKKIQAALVLIFCFAGICVAAFSVMGQEMGQAPPGVADWYPNRKEDRARFVGSRACARCHKSKAATQPSTPMGRALSSAADCEILRANPRLTFRNGPYSYTITREGNRSIYKVTDGTRSISLPLLYCFGNGEAGQTYVYEREGAYFESRLSFYNDTRGLDFTMGHLETPPSTLEEAAGRRMSREETRNCFSCHSTAAVGEAGLQLDHLIEGVSCEACHGPGDEHVAAMKAGQYDRKQIYNPGKLATEDMSNFCGACHRTWEQVAMMGLRGVRNVRFQPYRLTNSKCYDAEDRRISCTACHDPHEDLRHDSAFYDSKCMACHTATPKIVDAKATAAGGRVAPVCPTGKRQCASCHMPKLEMPGSHFKFTDHQIRVVRPDDPYPN